MPVDATSLGSPDRRAGQPLSPAPGEGDLPGRLSRRGVRVKVLAAVGDAEGPGVAVLVNGAGEPARRPEGVRERGPGRAEVEALVDPVGDLADRVQGEGFRVPVVVADQARAADAQLIVGDGARDVDVDD